MARVELLEVFALPDSTMFIEEISAVTGALDFFLQDKDIKGTVILTGRREEREPQTIFRINIDQSAVVNCKDNTDDLAEAMVEDSLNQKTITPLSKSRIVEKKRFHNTKCMILPNTEGQFFCSCSIDRREYIDEILRIIGRTLVNLSPGDEELRDNYEGLFAPELEENWKLEVEVDKMFANTNQESPIEEIQDWKQWWLENGPMEFFFEEG